MSATSACPRMRIGIAGPASLRLLRGFEDEATLPQGYEHPPMSALINGMLDRGHEVTVFTTSMGLPAPVVHRSGRLTVCIARREPRAARDLFRSERRDLVQLMKNHPTDILNAHWSYEFGWAALDSGIPALITLRDHAATVFKYRRNSYKFFRLLMNYYVLGRATYLSTNSQYLFDRLPPRYRNKARVISNFFPRDLMEFRGQGDARQSHVISIANGFGRLKNLHTAMRGYHIFRAAHSDVRYLLVGHDMERGGAAEAYARRKGIEAGIEFLGRRSHGEALSLLRGARAMLHPSLEESFGMSILEAMVVGTPVIAGKNSGNVPHLLDCGRAGVLCNVLSPEEIAAGLKSIVDDHVLASRLTDTAWKFAASNYSEERVLSSYIEYYQDILSGKA